MPQLILPPGTRVVTRRDVVVSDGGRSVPAGAVGVIVRAPADAGHAYRVRFPDGGEASLRRDELRIWRAVRDSGAGDAAAREIDWMEFVIFRCVVGSQAFGLAGDGSDVDRRGIYLPPAELQWALYGVPEQLENDETQEVYWELAKFLELALKANPGILECLYSPLVEHADGIAQELLAMRDAFLSRLVYQTYNGYVLSQFKKLEQDLRARGAIKWKHAMHLIRLLLSGITVLREGHVPVRVDRHRDRLLAIRAGEVPWEEIDEWRLALHREFDDAFTHTRLPERPDFERANEFLIRARRAACHPERNRGTVAASTAAPDTRIPRLTFEMPSLPDLVLRTIRSHPYPLLFATISGAHLYGFASRDSDFDVRGVHVLPLRETAGIIRGRDTIETMLDGPPEVDLVTHDAEKFFRLLLKRNGYVLEQLCSPLIAHSTPEHEELRALVPSLLTRHHAHHYLGFAESQWRLFEKERPRRIKPLLYVFRVLLTGIHLMRTGEVEANLPRLNESFRLPYIDELIARKTSGVEHEAIEDRDFRPEVEALRALLEAEAGRTRLADAPAGREALHDLLLRVRGV